MTNSNEFDDLVLRALGAAVVKNWSALPQAQQHDLFEDAVSAHGETMRPQLAVFLHDKHSRTSDSLKANAVQEPDSLGG